MAVFDPNRTADVADKAVRDRLSTPKNRIAPMKLRVIEDMKKQKVHVFNVGPWGQLINTGSTGTFLMPACPQDKDFIELLVDGEPPISVIMSELVIKSEDEYTSLDDDGIGFAHAMLGEGRGSNPAYALTHLGMFVAEGEKPTKKEIAEAKAKLLARCAKIYKEASDLYATDRKLFSRIVKPEVHFIAARVLGRDNPQDSPWMLDAAPVGRIKCKMCGRVVDPDVAMCEGGHIVNQELYLAAMAEQESVLSATKAAK